MAIVVEELLVRLRADLDQYNFQLGAMQRGTDSRLAALESRYAQFGRQLHSTVADTMVRINTALASVGAGLGVVSLLGYADAWTRITRAIDATNSVYGIQLASASRVAQMAVETRSDLEATEKLYTRTAISVSKLGQDMAVAERVTTTFAKALKLGGANTTEQTSAMLQFSQALQKGKLDGDEFRSIMENAGVIQQALIEKFKVSGSVLMDMAQKGKITAKDIIEALEQIKPKVDAAFDSAPTTLAESFTNLKTAITEYIGTADHANGVTQSLAAGVQSIAQNVDFLVRGAVTAAVALGLVFTPAMVAAVEAFAIAMLGVATATAPVMLVFGAITAGLVAFTAVTKGFGDQIDIVADKGVTLRDVSDGFYINLKKGAAEAFAEFSKQARDAFDALREHFAQAQDDADATNEKLLGGVKKLTNLTIGALMAVSYTSAAIIALTFGALPDAIVEVLNAALVSVRDFARSTAEILNKIPGVKIDVDAIDVHQFARPFEGAADEAAFMWHKATKAMGRDYIAEMGGAADAVTQKVMETAEALAKARNARQDTAQDAELDRPAGTPQPVYPDKADSNKYTKELEQIRKRTELLVAEAAAVHLSTAEQEKAKATQMLLTAAREADVKVTPEVTAAIEKLATSYGNATAQLKFLQAVQAAREDNKALQREVDLIGLYGKELYRARVEAELLAEARKAGTTLSDAKRAEISAIAAENASLHQLVDTMNLVKDTANSALKSFISDLRQGKSATEALGGSLNKIADKLIDMATEQLVMAALGPLFSNTKSSSGFISGVASMFGFAEGGVMTPQGPRALNKFATGGVSTQAAIFGEAGPEAAVPLPDGRRIPVDLRLPNMSALQQHVSAQPSAPTANVSVNNTFNVGGGVSATDIANLKREIAEALPVAVKNGVTQAFDRDQRFRRSGI
ncbi:MAG: tape measure protein [Hyphomicrobiaceae bacterium]